MEQVLIQQNRHWKKPYKNLIDRDILHSFINKLSLKEIQVVLGIRRSGKSTLFKLLINHLMKEHNPLFILNINFDDPYFTQVCRDASRIYQIVETAEKITGEKIRYLFLDEIQNVLAWEKFVKSVYDSNVFNKIFITGSNSSLLKGEYANLLSGRYVVDEVLPLSFNEILQETGIRTKLDLAEKKANVLSLLDTIMEYGAYPEVYKTKNAELKRELLINYYDTIVLKDCIANSGIREIRSFKEITYYLLSNVGTLFSYNSLGRSLNTNENSAKYFLTVLEDSFLLKEIRNFSFSLKKQSKARKKVYAVDNGILANVSFRFSANRGKLFENLVFTELKKRKYEIFFYHNKRECDFIVQNENGLQAIQVCYELNAQNQKREIEGLKEAMQRLAITEGKIITYNQEDEFDGLRALPFWKVFY